MQSFLQNSPKYAPTIARLGISAVFLWFGANELMHTSMWTGFVPAAISGLIGGNAVLVVLLNGWFEIVAGLTLAVGLQVRIVSFILALHLISISISLGGSSVAIRDYGLSIATISIFFAGADRWSLDSRLLAQKEESDLQ